jgi:hypothetical protein
MLHSKALQKTALDHKVQQEKLLALWAATTEEFYLCSLYVAWALRARRKLFRLGPDLNFLAQTPG